MAVSMSVSYTNHRSYGTAAKKPAKAAHAGERLVAQDFDPHGMAIAISESQRICCCRSVRERGSRKKRPAAQRLADAAGESQCVLRGCGGVMDKRTSHNTGRMTDAKRSFATRRRKSLTSSIFSSVEVKVAET
jgi:hypothetical protein